MQVEHHPLVKEFPALRVLMLSMHPENQYAVRALKAQFSEADVAARARRAVCPAAARGRRAAAGGPAGAGQSRPLDQASRRAASGSAGW